MINFQPGMRSGHILLPFNNLYLFSCYLIKKIRNKNERKYQCFVKRKEMELKTELRKLPKDILIEIIGKGFDWKDLSDKQLQKTFFEIRDILIQNMRNKVNNLEIILWKKDNERIIIEKYSECNIRFLFHEDEYKKEILKIDMFGKVIYGKYYKKDFFYSYDSFLESIKTNVLYCVNRNAENGDYWKDPGIDWSPLKQLYDDFSTWNEIRSHSSSIQ